MDCSYIRRYVLNLQMAQLRRQSFSGELFILPEEEENYENEEPNKDELSDYRSEFELYYLNL